MEPFGQMPVPNHFEEGKKDNDGPVEVVLTARTSPDCDSRADLDVGEQDQGPFGRRQDQRSPFADALAGGRRSGRLAVPVHLVAVDSSVPVRERDRVAARKSRRGGGFERGGGTPEAVHLVRAVVVFATETERRSFLSARLDFYGTDAPTRRRPFALLLSPPRKAQAEFPDVDNVEREREDHGEPAPRRMRRVLIHVGRESVVDLHVIFAGTIGSGAAGNGRVETKTGRGKRC